MGSKRSRKPLSTTLITGGGLLVLSGLYAFEQPSIAPTLLLVLAGTLFLLVAVWYAVDRTGHKRWFPRLASLIGMASVGWLTWLCGGFQSDLWPAFLLVAASAAPALTRTESYVLYGATSTALVLAHLLSPPTWTAYHIAVVVVRACIVLALTELYRHVYLQAKRHQDDLSRAVEREQQTSKNLSRRNVELNLLNNVATTLNSSLELNDVLTRVLELTNASMGIEIGSVSLLDDKSKELVIRTLVGRETIDVDGMHFPKDEGIAGWVYTHGETAMVQDVQNDPRFYARIDERTGFKTRNLLCIPLRSKERIIGVIEAINKGQGGFTAEDRQILEGLSTIAAPAIENASLHTRLKEVNDALLARYNELRQTQDQLVAAEKRAAAIELAGAAAHQLNQPLTVMLCSLGLVRHSLPSNHAALDDLDIIEQAVEKASQIVRRIGSLTDYKTKPYIEGIQILDIDQDDDASDE